MYLRMCCVQRFDGVLEQSRKLGMNVWTALLPQPTTWSSHTQSSAVLQTPSCFFISALS